MGYGGSSDVSGHKCASFFQLIFIGKQLLYNVVLVSTVQQNESARCVHINMLLLSHAIALDSFRPHGL